jgi:4-hydroxy-tetrahydrodipicolinate reductase
MVKIIITGVCGKMGNTILNIALKDRDLSVAGVLEAKTHPLIGKSIGSLESKAEKLLCVEGDLSNIIKNCDVIIDFTEPTASLEYFRIACESEKAIVIGTTGFHESALKEINDAGNAKVVISPNMSVGMNLMFEMVNKLSGIMKDDYDIEIVEMHHRMKKDAPSGTAIRLKDIIEASAPSRNWAEIFGRKGIIGERKKEELGILALRGGDIVGEHTVMFAGIGERLEITHRAYSRENFARGALLAAKWLNNQTNGVYSMKDVLGI